MHLTLRELYILRRWGRNSHYAEQHTAEETRLWLRLRDEIHRHEERGNSG